MSTIEEQELFKQAKTVYDSKTKELLTAQRRVREAKIALEIAHHTLQTLCKHNWVREPPACHSRTSYICSICGIDG